MNHDDMTPKEQGLFDALVISHEHIAQLQDIIGYISIHLEDEKWMVSRLTTEQREAWADSVDAWHKRLYSDTPDILVDIPPYHRWWRNNVTV